MCISPGEDAYRLIYNKRVCDYLTAIPKLPPNTGRNYSDHIGHNTVFFVPTYKIEGKGEHIDDICPETVEKFREAYGRNEELPNSYAGGFNVGHICPPFTPPATDCDRSGSNL